MDDEVEGVIGVVVVMTFEEVGAGFPVVAFLPAEGSSSRSIIVAEFGVWTWVMRRPERDCVGSGA